MKPRVEVNDQDKVKRDKEINKKKQIKNLPIEKKL